MTPSRRWLPWVGLLLTLLLVGFLPYRELVDQVPWGPDAAKWVDRGTLDAPGWTTWVFSSKHFIGYRPVPALTFVINEALTGYSPWGYRLTDLFLHLAVGAALFDLYRRLAGDRGAWGLAAVCLLFAHPATEEVVPFVARRSYLLQALFSLTSASLAMVAVRSARPVGWWAAVALLTGLALLSNEGGFVFVVWMPLLVLYHADGPPRTRARHLWGLVPVGLVTVAVLLRRVAVLGSLTGGYGKHFFAFVRHGKVMWRDMAQPDHLDILLASWAYTLAPHGVTGSWVPGLREVSPLAFASLVGALLHTSLRPLDEERDRPTRWLAPLLLVWMVGSTGIVVASGTWFWRQAYFLLPPVGLAFAWILRSAAVQARAGRWVLPLLAAPLLVLLPVAALHSGPVLHGMNLDAHATRIEYGDHVHAVNRLTADLQGPGTVYLALPAKAGAIHNVRIWANRFGADRGLVFKVIARMDNISREGRGRLTLTDPDGRPQLSVDGKDIRWDTSKVGTVRLKGVKKLYLDRLWVPEESRWLYTMDSSGTPVLVPIARPSESADDGRDR